MSDDVNVKVIKLNNNEDGSTTLTIEVSDVFVKRLAKALGVEIISQIRWDSFCNKAIWKYIETEENKALAAKRGILTKEKPARKDKKKPKWDDKAYWSKKNEKGTAE